MRELGGRTLKTASAGEQRPLGFILLTQPNCHDLDNLCKHSTNTELTVPAFPWVSSEPSLWGGRRLAHGWPGYHGIWERGAETPSGNLRWALCSLCTLPVDHLIPLPGLRLTTPEILSTPKSLSGVQPGVLDTDSQLLPQQLSCVSLQQLSCSKSTPDPESEPRDLTCQASWCPAALCLWC